MKLSGVTDQANPLNLHYTCRLCPHSRLPGSATPPSSSRRPAASASSPTRGSKAIRCARPTDARSRRRISFSCRHGHSDHSGERRQRRARDRRARRRASTSCRCGSNARACRTSRAWGSAERSSIAGLEITMTPAVHSSSVVENDAIVYLGEPAGFVVRLENGRAFYFAGDTALFGDMRADRGDARAGDCVPADWRSLHDGAGRRGARLPAAGVRQVVPMHYGTFPILTGTPERLKELVRTVGRRRAGAEAGGDGGRWTSSSAFQLPAASSSCQLPARSFQLLAAPSRSCEPPTPSAHSRSTTISVLWLEARSQKPDAAAGSRKLD